MQCLTGGDLLLRNKFIIIIYRGKDFLPCEIADLISKREMELQRCQLHEEHARLEVVGKFCVADEPQGNPQSAGTLSEFHDIQLEYRDSVEENRMVKLPLEAEKERIEREIRKQERKLFILSSKIEKSTKDLLKLNAAWKPSEKDADQEMLTDEERECFRMIGMKMHSVLVLAAQVALCNSASLSPSLISVLFFLWLSWPEFLLQTLDGRGLSLIHVSVTCLCFSLS
ncbi:hypothetical protein CsatA_001300 [Cannabis sativa]